MQLTDIKVWGIIECNHYCHCCHHFNITWASLCLKSTATWLFIQGLMQSKIQGSTKAPNHCLCERNPLVTSGFPTQTDGIAKTSHVIFHVWPVPSAAPPTITVNKQHQYQQQLWYIYLPLSKFYGHHIHYQNRLMNSPGLVALQLSMGMKHGLLLSDVTISLLWLTNVLKDYYVTNLTLLWIHSMAHCGLTWTVRISIIFQVPQTFQTQS